MINRLQSSSTPLIIQHAYINSGIFGERKNGIRLRAWQRIESGHIDIEVDVEVDGEIMRVIIYSLKVTPSMKNVVYCVHVVFDENGKYMPKQSKCDCPNGWLFCSHTLACFFLLIYLVQMKSVWAFAQIVQFLPVPIKSLQNYPFEALYVFGKLGCRSLGGGMVYRRRRIVQQQKGTRTIISQHWPKVSPRTYLDIQTRSTR